MPFYFGAHWDAPSYAKRGNTPVGEICLYCEEPIRSGEQGVAQPYVERHDEAWISTLRSLHRECHLRMGLGGLNHLEGRCSCQGGSEPPDPPELTKREAAKLVLLWVLDRQ